jgi:superoxide dismutase, Fe-Mn family
MKSVFYPLLSLMAVAAPLSGIDSMEPKSRQAFAEYFAKDYSYLYGMSGFNDALLKMHFQLYQGYVKNTNLLLTRLKELERQDKELSYEYGALKRRFAWEFDGMRLHEYYFENLGGDEPLDKSENLYQSLFKEFGSYEAWKKNFTATGMMRGIGWVILYRDLPTGRLINAWINEHDLGHLAGAEPLLVMDVFEHAYITQYGLDRGKYISAFFNNIHWEKVCKRFSAVQKNETETSVAPKNLPAYKSNIDRIVKN